MTDSQMDAPERVWVEYGQSGPEAMVWVGGSTIGLRKLPCYILATPEALAASLEVQALIAAELAARMTARQIIETRLGRSLGPIATMPQDLRRALYLLARQLVRKT